MAFSIGPGNIRRPYTSRNDTRADMEKAVY